MCFSDPGLIIGALSAAAGEVGKSQAAGVNAGIANQQARLEHASQEREFMIEANASNKEAYNASQERDRAVSEVRAAGAETAGSVIGERIGEQNRQSGLSIQNAKDRMDAAGANYAMAGQHSTIKAENDIAVNSVNPLTSFINIATGGLQGYGTIKTGAATTPTGQLA